MRTERDMLGERTLGDDTLYGLQTLRAFENFGTTFPRTNLSLIYAIPLIYSIQVPHLKSS